MFGGALFALRESNRERGQVTNLKNALYDSPDEEALHQHAIQNLADETNRPVDEVRSIYETAYLRLKPDADHRLPAGPGRATDARFAHASQIATCLRRNGHRDCCCLAMGNRARGVR